MFSDPNATGTRRTSRIGGFSLSAHTPGAGQHPRPQVAREPGRRGPRTGCGAGPSVGTSRSERGLGRGRLLVVEDDVRLVVARRGERLDRVLLVGPDELGQVDDVAAAVLDLDLAQRDRERLRAGDLGDHRRDLPLLVDRLDERVRVNPVLARRAHEVVEQLVLVDLDLEVLRERVEQDLVAQRRRGLLPDLDAVLGVVDATLGLQVTRHLGLDDALRDRDLRGGDQLLEELVTRLDGLVRGLDARDLLAQVRGELLEGVELARELGEVVVGRGKLALLDGRRGDRDLRLLASVLAAREGRLERRRLAGGQARHGLVEALEQVAGADAVARPAHRVDGLAVDRGLEVEDDEVTLGGGPVDADERAEALAQRVEALGDVLVGHLDVVDRDRDRVERRDGDLGPDLDLCGEVELAVSARGGALERGDLGDLDRGLTHRAQLVLADRLGVEAREPLVDRVLDDRDATDPLVDDARRDLALAEAGHGDLLGDVLVRVVDARLELVVRHLDGQLDLGGVQGLDGALHFSGLQLLGAGAGDSGDIRGVLRRAVPGPEVRRGPDGVRRHASRDPRCYVTAWRRPKAAGESLIRRDGGIRTHDLPLPKRTRYQPAPHPVRDESTGARDARGRALRRPRSATDPVT